MSQSEMQAFERAAEEAYEAMYDARRPKDCYEDAMSAFYKAIEAAKKAGLQGEADRLSRRRDHVRNVYTHQFRGF